MQREFFLQTGETHALELEGNLTSGFEWTFSSNNPGIAEIQKEVQAPYPEYPGNPNKVLFTITALAPGVALHVRLLHVFGTHRVVIAVKAEGNENSVGNILF